MSRPASPFVFALSLIALGASPPARAQLSPRVRMVARGQLAARAIARPGEASGRLAQVTVRVAGGAERLRQLGLPAVALSPGMAALELDAAALAWLAAAFPGEPLAIEERRLLRPLLDRAGPAIGAPLLREQTGLTGHGSLVGVVDSGVDFRHADLRNLDGTTRVRALYDRRTMDDGRHAALGSFGGAVWHKDEIDRLLAAEAAGVSPTLDIAERDIDGHGTHVASIAASNGLATGRGLPAGRYVGIAPGAELLIAQASDANGGFTDVSVLSACQFLVAEQVALARPMVVNVSLGGAGGPHDGSTNLEVGLDQLFPPEAPGRALVVAAGNTGARDLHAGGWSLDGELVLPLSLRAGEAGALALELWYRGEVAVAVQAPSGRRSAAVPRGQSLDVSFSGEARVLIDNASLSGLASGLIGAGVVLEGAGTDSPATGAWQLIVRGRAIRYDAWLLDTPLAARARFVDRVVPDDHLAVPATARGAISVGALGSRFDWTTYDERAFVLPGVDPARLGTPSFFTAAGPTADGRFAPDLAAPGEFVIAAMSQDAPPTIETSSFRSDPGDLGFLWADDGKHGALRGTSQASPVVAGAIALLFEAAPTLRSDAVREILRVTSAPVAGQRGWSPRSGFGRLDLPAALDFLRGGRGGPPSARASRVGVTRDQLPPDSEELTLVTVTPCDEAGRPLGAGHAVHIELSAGAPSGPVRDLGSGRYERSFVAHAPRGAIGVVRVTVDGVVLDAQPRVFFVPSRAEIGGDLVPGGGCAIGGSLGGRAIFTLALVQVLVLLRRRRRG